MSLAASTFGTLLGAVVGLARLAVQVLSSLIHPLLRAYYDYQTRIASESLDRAIDCGDLDGARHLRRRLLSLKAAREHID